jgi:ankyrin repeat protein
MLLQAGADVRSQIDEGGSAVEAAVRELLDIDGRVNLQWHRATLEPDVERQAIARAECLQVLHLLLDAGANVNRAFITAVMCGGVELVQELLHRGADVQTQEDQALRAAAERGYAGMVRLLLRAGADVHARDGEALRLALENVAEPEVTSEPDDDPHDPDNEQWRAWHLARQNARQEVAQLLREAGA